MSMINEGVFDPSDAASLHRATARVIEQVGDGHVVSEGQADEAARAVLSVVRTGYARIPDQAIDTDDLADAAIARVRAAGH